LQKEVPQDHDSHAAVCCLSVVLHIFLTFSVALTKVEKRSTRDQKSNLIQEVRNAVDKHDSLYVFTYENMRSSKFKNVRMHFRDSGRIFMGKNKILQIALGRTPEDEYADNLRHVSKLIVGASVGLLFTDKSKEDVEQYFRSLIDPDFARAGAIATRDAEVTQDMVMRFPTSMMETFRKLGLPVEIKNGSIVLRGQSPFKLCKEGETLSAEKCKLLVHFGIKLVDFQVSIVARWSNGEFEELQM
jgi:mRNA turnover protein 4